MQVRAGCLEAVLGLAIYAKQHADVWDAAAALLREHSGELSVHRMQVGTLCCACCAALACHSGTLSCACCAALACHSLLHVQAPEAALPAVQAVACCRKRIVWLSRHTYLPLSSAVPA